MTQNLHPDNLSIIVLTGASGAGKTTVLQAAKQSIRDNSIVYLHFDSIGVPDTSVMTKKYGSPSEWQKAMMHAWVQKIFDEYGACSKNKLVILEGQINLRFIQQVFQKFNFKNYQIVLAHCDDFIRHKRLLIDRNQADLINFEMDNWAKFLKKQALEMNVNILDTSLVKLEMSVESFIKLINQMRNNF